MTTRRPVLIVSYYFPPTGGAGTQRFAGFARWLPDFGYQPIIVTSDASQRPPCAPTNDTTLIADLPSDVIVTRVGSEAPLRSSPVRGIRRITGLDADHERWCARALPAALRVARDHPAAAIVTTASPYGVWTIGRDVRARLGIPWILDLRDPWALDGWWSFPTPLHAHVELRRMRRALREADAVIANTPQARRAYIELIGADDGRVCTIPNGFEPGDFKPHAGGESERDGARVFRLVHVGTLHDPLRGRRRPRRAACRRSWCVIDQRGRSGRYLFEALAELRRDDPAAFARLQIDLVGNIDQHHRYLARSLRIDDRVMEHGYLPHRDAIRRLMNADAVFVPLHGVPNGDPALVVPGKLYEAIASERSVLGCLPEGDAARLLRLTDAGIVVRPDDVPGIGRALGGLVRQWMAGRPRPGAPRARLVPFTRRRLTQRLAAAIDAVLDQASRLSQDDPWDELARRGRSVDGETRSAAGNRAPTLARAGGTQSRRAATGSARHGINRRRENDPETQRTGSFVNADDVSKGGERCL